MLIGLQTCHHQTAQRKNQGGNKVHAQESYGHVDLGLGEAGGNP